jgi:S-DNA-T family DNA segregation ATPase FtsK/SpoIIIE
MPHLLIAGSTGTGKSVGLNAMLTSILYRSTPDDVRMIMIDPKRLELGMYEDIPHLLTPVVMDPKKASNALRWAVREMEERYKTLAAEGVRNIDQYNRNVRRALSEGGAANDPEAPRPLPFIVVVIDELADLMMVASSEVEQSIARLAQMARAVGIHLILATQRPSVDVITGLIKANLPSRISFRVSSKTDSRTILDSNGAEQLLGRGDMLFLPPASARCTRLHGPYISEQESARLASFLRKQGKPVFNETITAEDEKTGPGSLEFEKDELYDEAARVVVTSGQVSISYLQRRLRVGFSRAARLVDMMEAEGLVSPGTGGKPREVLVDRGYFEEVDAQLRERAHGGPAGGGPHRSPARTVARAGRGVRGGARPGDRAPRGTRCGNPGEPGGGHAAPNASAGDHL